MDCVCHGEPAYWQKDSRCKAGGWWECTRKRQNANAKRAGKAHLVERRRELWHAPNGGYVRRRKADLAAMRADVLERLDQLEREADALC